MCNQPGVKVFKYMFLAKKKLLPHHHHHFRDVTTFSRDGGVGIGRDGYKKKGFE